MPAIPKMELQARQLILYLYSLTTFKEFQETIMDN